MRWGVAAEQGHRAQMEDTHVGVLNLEAHYGQDYGSPERSAFFGVSDAQSPFRVFYTAVIASSRTAGALESHTGHSVDTAAILPSYSACLLLHKL